MNKIDIAYRVVEVKIDPKTFTTSETPLVAFDNYESAEQYIEEKVLGNWRQYGIRKVYYKKEIELKGFDKGLTFKNKE